MPFQTGLSSYVLPITARRRKGGVDLTAEELPKTGTCCCNAVELVLELLKSIRKVELHAYPTKHTEEHIPA